MKEYLNKTYLPAMLGAAIEYYDIALYGFMAPILVQVFLPHLPKTTAYFFYFLFEFFASLAQLAGAYFFGKMGDNDGRKNAMYYAMIGTSCTTFIVSVLPSYLSLGIFASFLFFATRLMQGFFLGGEYNGGAIYCLEHEQDHRKHGTVSGLYCALTACGIITASLAATAVNHYGSEYFRIAYGVSFLLAMLTFFLRKSVNETSEFLKAKLISNKHFIRTSPFKLDYKNLVSLGIASLLFGILYGIPTRIFNAIIPLVTSISTNLTMIINSAFLVLYMLLLIMFGIIANRFKFKKMMYLTAFLTALLAYPIIMLIESRSLEGIIIAKAIFTCLAAAFISPLHAFAQSLFITEERYKLISIGYTLGKCCSTLIIALSVTTYDYLGNLYGIASILTIIAIITWRALYEKQT
ncbi:hypothetical protein NF27_BK00100 [Candidatus Jidaibacter acanthamoeba]|uniref:Major facilitator superfamily (MFS) profile domain-containing protein n=1 Tax=Candidatus Jidaibacter acanthamoebae TaxID=86105 RepID=A0A0C1QKR8_9RICK|nr:MFS transporter [Candidatus Jidaibacter acanthamoeba]KIE06089.1 hypothetical protein NF27_BK00100 [Candidatus Jidaibacter acanthamoeba]